MLSGVRSGYITPLGLMATSPVSRIATADIAAGPGYQVISGQFGVEQMKLLAQRLK